MLGSRCVSSSAACLVAALIQACADDEPANGASARTQITPSALRADSSVDDALGAVIALNHEIHTAHQRVRADLAQDRFALMDAFISARAQDESPTGIVRAASKQVLAYLSETEDERTSARTESLLARFSELLVSPRGPVPELRYDNYIRDADAMLAALRPALSSDDPTRPELAYYRTPAFNVLSSTRILILVTQARSTATIEEAYAAAIEVDQHLVGEDGSGDRGYLHDYVVSWTRSSGVSRQQQYDSDPVVASTRRALSDLQLVLE